MGSNFGIVSHNPLSHKASLVLPSSPLWKGAVCPNPELYRSGKEVPPSRIKFVTALF